MMAAMGRCLAEMKRFWKLNVPVYPDGLHMMSWKAGLFMPPHADNAYPDGKPHELAYRDLSGVLYLNDSFEGGGLYLTAADVLLKPRRGTMISMTGGFHHEHGVVRVESGLRDHHPVLHDLRQGARRSGAGRDQRGRRRTLRPQRICPTIDFSVRASWMAWPWMSLLK